MQHKNTQIGEVTLKSNGKILFEGVDGTVRFIDESQTAKTTLRCVKITKIKSSFRVFHYYQETLSINDLF